MNRDQEIQQIRSKLADEDWISPKTLIRESALGGEGLFALEKIKTDELVIVWGGEYVNKETAEKAKQNGFLVMQWDDDLFSVEERGEGTGYFVNHSCKPNLWLSGPYALIAMRDIDKGEEVTADYAMWEADENYISKWDCNCGSKDCRHHITGNDWKLPKLQMKYQGHFSPLINKRIQQKINGW